MSKLRKKSLIILAVIAFVELIIIIILIFNLPPQEVTMSKEELWEYCSEEFNSELCDEYYDEISADGNIYYVDPEVYEDSFRMAYADILNSKPIDEETFINFVILSEYYSDDHITSQISGENLPTKYTASISRSREREGYGYPYGVVRRIKLDVPEEGCAVFDFFPDFSFLYEYSLEYDEACDGTH